MEKLWKIATVGDFDGVCFLRKNSKEEAIFRFDLVLLSFNFRNPLWDLLGTVRTIDLLNLRLKQL